MSIDWESVWTSIKDNKGKIALIGLGLVLLVGVSLWGYQAVENHRENKAEQKDKQAIANKTADIANKTAQIDQIKQDRANDIGELKVLTDNLVNANIADNRAKEEVQQAVANLQAVQNSNANAVNARVDDINRKLDQLGIQ